MSLSSAPRRHIILSTSRRYKTGRGARGASAPGPLRAAINLHQRLM